MKRIITALLTAALLLLTACGQVKPPPIGPGQNPPPAGPGQGSDLKADETVYGDSLEELGAMDGYFEDERQDINVKCLSGTQNAFSLSGSTLTFTAINTETVYSISGKFSGNIVIDVGDTYKFDLELHGLSLVSEAQCPIVILSGDEVSITAKKGFDSYIYDMRSADRLTADSSYPCAIHSEVDLEIAGKGALKIVSSESEGIYSKKDLQVKNLSLLVSSTDNSLKGKDSVEITSAQVTLISTVGDGIKTSNSDISNKGNQRGTVSISDSKVDIYAACDGIDAAYNVLISGEASSVAIYTDKYSIHSGEITDSSGELYYIRNGSANYSYSVRYTSSTNDKYEWVSAEYHSSTQGGPRSYHYYSFPKKAEYDKIQLFVYSSGQEQGQDENYYLKTEILTLSDAFDTLALSSRGYSWTSFTTSVQGGHGGMQEGNSDKSDRSAKGIKAANEIIIQSGNINVKSYDDAIHASNDTLLENGETALGNVRVSGGVLTVYTNDDGIHADGSVSIVGGSISILYSYEGVEGERVSLLGGSLSVASRDDGINGGAKSGTAIEIGGGYLYVYCSGDGIDSNSSTNSEGIVFSGGNSVIISNSRGNSAIDSERGYTYRGGAIIAIMPSGAMTGESTNCNGFVGKVLSLNTVKDGYINAKIGAQSVTVKMPVSLSATLVLLGDSSASATTADSCSVSLDGNGVCWRK